MVILDNIGHAEGAQHRPSGTASKMNKADLLFSCDGGRAAVRAADHVHEAPRDARAGPEGRYVAVHGGRHRRSSRRAGRRSVAPRGPTCAGASVRLGCRRSCGALGDEPMSAREVAKAAGTVNGAAIPKSSAYDALVDLEIADKAAQRDGGWVGVRVSEPLRTGTPDAREREPLCEGCGGLLADVGAGAGAVWTASASKPGNERPSPVAPIPRIALTREEAAAALGMSLDSFERHVQPELRLIRRGRLRLVPVPELERWADGAAERTLR